MLGSPEETAYDLRFRVLGIPVRVHPLFWLVMLIISGHDKNLPAAAVFVVCAFISVLVHELGHGLSSRASGDEPTGIVLYAMGGFCSCDMARMSAWQRLFVLICGPGAGFLLMGVVLAGAWAGYGVSPLDAMAIVGIGDDDRIFRAILSLPPSLPIRYAFISMLVINFWWGVFNLLPIWPLDGGRITGVILGAINPREGTRWGHIVSLLTAALIALWLASRGQYWNALWLGYFGLINYQMLQSLHYASQFADEGEWWRR